MNSDHLIPMHCSGEPFITNAMQELAVKVLRTSTGKRLLYVRSESAPQD